MSSASNASSQEDSASDVSGLSLASDELMLGRLAADLQTKVEELKTEIHPDLGPYLVRYADALLTKEEDNLNPFEEEGEPEEAKAEQTTDLQTAWECFEQARLCYEKTNSPNFDSELGYIHQRLGDLLTMQSAADGAAEEYEKALKYVPPGAHRARAGILLVLGQALLMAQKYEQGKKHYVDAETEFNAWKAGCSNPEELEIINASMAEVEDALKDCDVAIRSIFATHKKEAAVKSLEQKLGASDATGNSTSFDKSSGTTKDVITLVPKRKTPQTAEEHPVSSPDAKKKPRLA